MMAGKIIGGILFGIPGALVGSIFDNLAEENKEVKQENTYLKKELAYHEETLELAGMTKEELRFQSGTLYPYAVAVLSHICREYINSRHMTIWLTAIQAAIPGYKGVTTVTELYDKADDYFRYKPITNPRTLLFDTPSKRRALIMFLDVLASSCSEQALYYVEKNTYANEELIARDLQTINNELNKIASMYNY